MIRLYVLLGVLLHIPLSLKAADLGKEIAIERHFNDGEEFSLPLNAVIQHGRSLFEANWTIQEGGGRPMSKGVGTRLANPSEPLVFPRNFNRISAPDANSCAGCHNSPVSGGDGDIVANVFVLGQRFDFATFDSADSLPTAGAVDELGRKVTLSDIANSRATLGMFGSGYIEMLSRQMTAELQAKRDALSPGESTALETKGVHFGTLSRHGNGNWDTSGVVGLSAPSIESENSEHPPSLLIRPFHQVGAVVSIRQFSNNAFNHHHGIQSSERFGDDLDPDEDNFTNELTRGDITAVSIFQAVMAPPGRVIPNDPEVELAVLNGEVKFESIGCSRCHIPYLPLDNEGWIYSEPNPFNPPGNLQAESNPSLKVDLSDDTLPGSRLKPIEGIVYVPAFTDLKLHDITSGTSDPNQEPLNMHFPAGSDNFFKGNGRFLTRKLWGVANKPNYFHHGKFTTMREAILAHDGDSIEEKDAFVALSEYDQASIIEFLKTLRHLPPDAKTHFVDDLYQPKRWPPPRIQSIQSIPGGKIELTWGGVTALYPQPPVFQLQSNSHLGSETWLNVGEPSKANRIEISRLGDAGFFRIINLED